MIIVAICKITYFPYLIPDYITKKAPTKGAKVRLFFEPATVFPKNGQKNLSNTILDPFEGHLWGKKIILA